MNFFLVLTQIMPLFLTLGAGFVLGKLKRVDDNFSAGLSCLCVDVLFPCSVIKAFYGSITAEMLSEGWALIVIGVAVLLATLLLAALIVKLLKIPVPSSNIVYFSVLFSNFGFVGTGMLQAVYGDAGLYYMMMFCLVLRIFFYSFGVVIMQRGTAHDGKVNILRSLANPAILSVAVAFLILLLDIKLPPVIEATIGQLSACLAPIGMLTVGIVMSHIPLREFLGSRMVYFLAAMRLVLIPLAAGGTLWLFGLRGLALNAVVLTLALPAAANTSLLAERYGGDVVFGTQVVTITNAFSVFTIPVVASISEYLSAMPL